MSANDSDPISPPPVSRSGALSPELMQRIGSGLVIGAAALALTYWSPFVFAILTVLAGTAMSWEWGRMVRGAMPDAAGVVHCIAVAAVAALTLSDMAGLSVAVALIGAIAAGALSVGSGQARLSAVGVIYTCFPVIALGWLRSDEPLGFLAVLFVVAAVVVTDVAAFTAGRSLGGPKLWPAVSPNKTWSGLIGGIAGAGITGALFAVVSGSGAAGWLALLGLVLGAVAQAGDLAESAMKRHFGVKDSGNLIPGHGGVMDRMDGIVTASVLAAIVALAIDAFAPARALLYGS